MKNKKNIIKYKNKIRNAKNAKRKTEGEREKERE